MKVNIKYSDYISATNKDGDIEEVVASISDIADITIVISTDIDGSKQCNLKISDSLLATEVSSDILKEDISELMDILKKIYGQL